MAATVELEVYHHSYINGVMGSFFRGIADFFRTELYPRTTEMIISTYEKGLVHYQKRIETLNENHHPRYPFVTFIPSMDFEPEERAGRFFYGYPAFDNKFALEQFGPVLYNDDNVKISPVLNRYKGRFEVMMWCSSVYEAMDYRVLAYQFFGGIGRPIYPKNIEGYFILPDELVTYHYTNDFTGESYDLDWENNTPVTTKLIKNINQNKYVFPFSMTPHITLTGISDGSESYGADDLSEQRLSLELEWEGMIPTHFIFQHTHLPKSAKKFEFQITSGFNYVQATGGSTAEEIMVSIYDSTNETFERVDAVYKDVFNYIITQDDSDAITIDNDDIVIDLGVTVEKPQFIQVFGKYGKMKRSFHWELEDNHNVVLIGPGIDRLDEGDVISIIIYEDN